MGISPARSFQGTKLSPWLFVIMINDWDVGAPKMWKYVDDTSMVETIKKGDVRIIQDSVDELLTTYVVPMQRNTKSLILSSG